MVRMGGFEPPHQKWQYPLKLACQPLSWALQTNREKNEKRNLTLS